MAAAFDSDSLQNGWRLGVAHGMILLLAVLDLISFSMPYAGNVRPFFLLVGVYYWAVYRPTLMPPWYVFALGLMTDILSGLPVGLSAFVLVCVQWIVRSQRLYLMGQSFLGMWMGFGVTCLIVAAMQIILFSVVTQSLPPVAPALASVGLSVCLFPAISLALVGTHRLLPASSA